MQKEILFVALIGLVSCGQVFADAKDAAQRRAALAAIPDRVNDPDPTMRLANMEDISSTGDVLAIQIAIKSALASKDPELHSLALRAYFKAQDHLQLELQLPADMQQDRLRQQCRPCNFFDGVSGRLLYDIDAVDFSRGRFTVYSMNNLRKRQEGYEGNGQVSGATITFTTNIQFGLGYQCAVQLRPTADLRLVGDAACTSATITGRFPVSMTMY